MVHTYNGILFSLKKELYSCSGTCYNIDEPRRHDVLSEVRLAQKDKYCVMLPILGVVTFTET